MLAHNVFKKDGAYEEAELLEVVVLAGEDSALDPLLDEPPELPRKSVTYQPEPLSANPAAVTCLLNAAAPQLGQTLSGASLIFCKTS